MSRKGGFRPLSRAAGLVDEGIVHEQAGVHEYQRVDKRKDAVALWAFGALRQVFAQQPAALVRIERYEREYWQADAAADRSVAAHAAEGVALFQELSSLLVRSAG